MVITWKIIKNNKKCTDIREIVVSSNNLKRNQLVCSLLENGWIVLKVVIRHKKENVHYVYRLGKPMAV